MKEFSFSEAVRDATQFVDELTYGSYRHNRRIAPDVTPERWEIIYGPKTAAMETRLQSELNACNAL